eukprot:CAMPEP_0194031294 /NCGR_PEP_ID=MMETSP0009_2-20130614/4508_1 /TAXON_ID=210454 /ORGANISM="Grammatophora oceanica, Strain CCMP 410" /LENGTH=83 /DNA_ID=CAMNT_0038671419 /DNA_START=389 /DNA_END=640 /DNA_ORIENTATION=+
MIGAGVGTSTRGIGKTGGSTKVGTNSLAPTRTSGAAGAGGGVVEDPVLASSVTGRITGTQESGLHGTQSWNSVATARQAFSSV